MTWSHPRGYDPLIACTTRWSAASGIAIDWDKRSLQDFESFPVQELARQYDLIVIDHPHVGQITREDCLEPLDIAGREPAREALAAGSVGRSYESYCWQGRQWAFPIDAAAQVQACRPDLLATPPTRWGEVVDLARKGRVAIPLRPPHSLMSFYTLAANLGFPCRVEGQLIDPEAGTLVVEHLLELASLVDPACFEMDPIAVFELMAAEESRIACAPLIYGYVSYALDGFRSCRLVFSDMPVAGVSGPVGSALGGTGIAVSAFSQSKDAAIDFAYWIASGEIQKTVYAAGGGQPGHLAAWRDPAVNAITGNFYLGTLATLDSAWVRPRHDGYMAFQQAASDRLNAGLREPHAARVVVDDLNALFEKSFGRA